MSRHGPLAIGGSWVVTGFDVATQFSRLGENLCRDRGFPGRDRVGHDGGG